GFGPIRAAFSFPVGGRVSLILTWFLRALFLVALGGAISGATFSMSLAKTTWSPLLSILVMAIAFAGLHLIILFQRTRGEIRRVAPQGVTLLVAFLIGYAPKLYYNCILKRRSFPKLVVGGDFFDVAYRLKLLWQAICRWFGLDRAVMIKVLFALFVLACA